MRWILSMAWRDSRGSRRRMLLFVGSMVLGVAALVAINSFGTNLRSAIDEQAKALLGADMSLESDVAFADSIEVLIAEIGGEQSRRTSFQSMAQFESGVRLSTVRAQDGIYPWYGAVETDPPEAATGWVERGEALVDQTLFREFDLAVGDSVRIGYTSYRIGGRLLQTPRESAAAGLVSPRVYIPIANVDTTLFGFGSQADYEVYFRFTDGRDYEALADSLRPALRPADVGVDSVFEEQENWDESLTNLYRFLSLVGFIALLLGSLGVASAVHVYIRQRIDTVATLRCFGAKSSTTIMVYAVQALGMGLIGATVGALIGIGIQLFVPTLLADALPVDVEFALAPGAILLGAGIGVGVTVLFALLPLLAVRGISPLRAIRAQVDPVDEGRTDGLTWLIRGIVAAGVIVFSMLQAPSPMYGFWYAVAIAAVFGALALLARGLIWAVQRIRSTSMPYVARQGLANLHRPNNQTLLLTLALGLGTFLIGIMLVTERTLVAQVDLSGRAESPNLVFFDIQTDQVEGVRAVLEEEAVPVVDEVALVTMRIASVKGRTVEEIRADSTREGPRWPFFREYRSTYRGNLTSSETLVAGEFTPSWSLSDGAIPVSVEQDLAADLDVALGDTIVWDVQGVDMTTVIGSVREVDWRRVQTNFFFVFPEGILEAAPQFTVVLARAPNADESADAQAAVARAYPNVSAIDVSLVLSVFEAIFSRIEFVIRFMALFSILTGFVVLFGAVLTSRLQRISETVLLKTLGASGRQVVRIMLVEYIALGALASLTGLGLALLGGWALAQFVFETPVATGGPVLLWISAGVVGLVVMIGVLSSRGVYRLPALEVLRSEG
ncbi:MAG: ABC transporter permease [Rhodothermales bacterium]|nr:ABC transporter permease [Rhodothermales bacterium]MBO6781554.1 ABC transporter permease [Rhodothermales bacterium]